jgi:hypothetical protein
MKKNFKKIFVLFSIISTISPIVLAFTLNPNQNSGENFPIMDGFWSEGEWPDSIITQHVFNDFKSIQFAYRVNDTHIFLTARYYDKDPSIYNKTCNNFLLDLCSDSFAIGFDLNGDQSNMGSKNSPDDSIYVGLYDNSSIDVYMQGIGNRIVFDTENGGTEDTFGKYSLSSDNYFTFEVVKRLSSNDEKGYDINLKKGSEIYVMLAYWNNLAPRTEISGFSKWFKISINDPLLSNFETINFLPPLFVAFVITTVLFVIRLKF